MTAIPPTAPHPPFTEASRHLRSPGVRATVALGAVLLAVVSWSAIGGHLDAEIPTSLVVFLMMTLVALTGAVTLHKLQGRTGSGHRPSL